MKDNAIIGNFKPFKILLKLERLYETSIAKRNLKLDIGMNTFNLPIDD